MWKPFALMFAAVALLATFGCSELDPANPVTGDAAKADEGFGNCLSVPVIWSDGYDLALRGTFGAPVFDGEFQIGSDGVTTAWLQQDPFNAWQAESMMGSAEGTAVDWIDWGDNLESKAWPANAKVRVEVVLFEDLLAPAVEFEMTHVSGLGIDEMWGATQNVLDGTQATVYSHCARLTIQKLEENAEDLTWNPTLGQWEGDISLPYYNSAVFDAGESPITKYSAEINVKGKVIYGMLWDVATNGDGMGTYRLTFSLDPNGPVTLNTVFDEFTQIMEPAEEEEAVAYSPDKAEPTGGVTYIDVANNLTYMDLPITRAKGGGGGGGGKPDKPGGGHGGGGGGGGGGHGGGH